MRFIRRSLLIVIFCYLFLFIYDFDDVIYNKVNSWVRDLQGLTNRIDLNSYQVLIEEKKITPIKDNLSGISYNPNSQTLFAITNRPREIHELSKDGQHLRTISLKGFRDTEGITHIKDSKFAIVDERLQTLFILNIESETEIIDIKDVENSFALNIGTFKNFGYEGIGYNTLNGDFYIANERFPTAIITLSNWLEESKNLKITFKNPLDNISYYVSDLSGIHFDVNSENILILSHESKLLTEMNTQGSRLSFMDLEKNFVGLSNDISQAEGITMDETGDIYIVGEPNLFYRFSKNN